MIWPSRGTSRFHGGGASSCWRFVRSEIGSKDGRSPRLVEAKQFILAANPPDELPSQDTFRWLRTAVAPYILLKNVCNRCQFNLEIDCVAEACSISAATSD